MNNTADTVTVKEARSPQVGDILTSSWGYDQTNVDCFQVVAIGKHSVRLRQIKTEISYQNELRGSDKVSPVKDAFLELDNSACSHEKPYRAEKGALRKWSHARDGYSCKISDSQWAYLWTGRGLWQTSQNAGH